MKLIQILIISVALASCWNKPHQRAELKTCVNQKVNRHFTDNGLDFYSIMADVEEKLMIEGVLQNKTKKAYLALLNAPMISKNKFGEMNIFLESKGFYYKDHVTYIFGHCPCKIAKRDVVLKKQCSLVDKATEGSSKMILSDYINITNSSAFNHIEYRAPIILLYLITNLEKG